MNAEQETSRSKGKKVELIIQQLNSLPTLPAVAVRLLQITVNTRTQANEVVELIQSDQSLTSKIITISTRANKGISRKSVSLSKAVVMLGFDTIRNAVLSIKVFETLGGVSSPTQGHFKREEFWKHSLAVACTAKMLIKEIDPRVDEEEAFVCGLLHDMGKVALDACLPRSFSRVVQIAESSLANIADVEKKVLGIDHTVVGKRLAEKWQLPLPIIETIWLHHQSTEALPEAVRYRNIVKTVHLADLLVREQRIGYSGNHYFAEKASAVAEKLGCSASTIDRITRELRVEISERASMLGLDEIEPEDLYHDALAEANNELGKLNYQLHEQNQALALRSQYFDLLSQLGTGLQAGHSVVDVCSLLAELWLRHVGSKVCAVYADVPDEWIIEGVVKTQDDLKPAVFLVDRTDDPDVISRQDKMQHVEGFSIKMPGENQLWFFEQVAPQFELSTTLTMPLLYGREHIGSILWQEDENHPNYQDQIKEIQSFATSAALAIRQAQKQEQQVHLCEQMADTNRVLHEAQRELLQKRSLAAVGEMACGAAHEINNPLAIIVGRSQFLATSEQEQQRKEMLEAISRQGQVIADIVSELMEFAKPSIPQPHSVTIQKLLDQVVATRRAEANDSKIDIEIQLQGDLPEVFVDQDQIHSAMSELLSNAIDSYQGKGGKINLNARFDEMDNEIILEIVDQGIGMDNETLRKAMDPFFSAKTAGRNRGLGLSHSTRYIESNGGHLHLVSEEGKGTVARVILPVSQIAATDEILAT
jgi:putative nucleotidyltransferase with HDIG domain